MKTSSFAHSLAALIALTASTAAFADHHDEGPADRLATPQPTAKGKLCTSFDAVEFGQDDAGNTFFKLKKGKLTKKKGKSLERSTCLISMPLTATPGQQFTLKEVSLEGEGKSGVGSASLEVFFGGGKGDPLKVEVKPGAFSGKSENAIAGECGAAPLLRANLSLVLTGKPAAEAKISQIAYKLDTRPCTAEKKAEESKE